jgi:hypothetical protein
LINKLQWSTSEFKSTECAEKQGRSKPFFYISNASAFKTGSFNQVNRTLNRLVHTGIQNDLFTLVNFYH